LQTSLLEAAYPVTRRRHEAGQLGLRLVTKLARLLHVLLLGALDLFLLHEQIFVRLNYDTLRRQWL